MDRVRQGRERNRAGAPMVALEKVGAARTRRRERMEQIDEAIVDLGSVERAWMEKVVFFEERDRLLRESGELETQLKGLSLSRPPPACAAIRRSGTVRRPRRCTYRPR